MAYKFNNGMSVPPMRHGSIPKYDAQGHGPIFGHFQGGGIQQHPNMGPDVVDAKLKPGEYVVKSEAVDQIGVPALDRLNNSVPTQEGYTQARYPQGHMGFKQSPPPKNPQMGSPVMKVKETDRYGNSREITYDTKAGVESSRNMINGMGLSAQDDLWNSMNDWQQPVPAMEQPPIPMMSGGPIYAEDGGFWGALTSGLGGLFGSNDDDEYRRQQEAGYAGYNQQDFLDEANAPNSQAANSGYSAPTSSPYEGLEVPSDIANPAFVSQFTGNFDENNMPVFTQPNGLESTDFKNALDSTASGIQEGPATEGIINGFVEAAALAPEAGSDESILKSSSEQIQPVKEQLAEELKTAQDIDTQLNQEAEVAEMDSALIPNPNLAPTANPHEGITDGRANLDLDSQGNILSVNPNRLLSEERQAEVAEKLASGSITEEQYNNIMSDHNAATQQQNAFTNEQARVQGNEQTAANRVSDDTLMNKITAIDTKISEAQEAGDTKLVEALTKVKDKRTGELSDDSQFVKDLDAKAANEQAAKVDGAAKRIVDMTGDNSAAIPLNPEQQKVFDEKATTLITTAENNGGSTGDPAEDSLFKKQFSGVFSDLFGPSEIGSILTRGLLLYAGGRLTGMSGQQAMGFAAKDALAKGASDNKSIADRRAKIADGMDSRRKDAVTLSKDYTTASIRDYINTGDFSVLVGKKADGSDVELGKVTGVLQDPALGKINVHSNVKGQGAYVRYKGYDANGNPAWITESQDEFQRGNGRNSVKFDKNYHDEATVTEKFTKTAKSAIDNVNKQLAQSTGRNENDTVVDAVDDLIGTEAWLVYDKYHKKGNWKDRTGPLTKAIKDSIVDYSKALERHTKNPGTFEKPGGLEAFVEKRLFVIETGLGYNNVENTDAKNVAIVQNLVKNTLAGDVNPIRETDKAFGGAYKQDWQDLNKLWSKVEGTSEKDLWTTGDGWDGKMEFFNALLDSSHESHGEAMRTYAAAMAT